MKKTVVILVILAITCSFCAAWNEHSYYSLYGSSISAFRQQQQLLIGKIRTTDIHTAAGITAIKQEIEKTRLLLKSTDFWLRYLEPLAYKKINGPLPVEWENEVFEKFEKPYRREGAGLSLAELYLSNEDRQKDSLIQLISQSAIAVKTFEADSITTQLRTPDHFFFCNRLYLLNLAAIYTTGFECPDTRNIIPELRSMMEAVKMIALEFNHSYPATPLSTGYMQLYDSAINFVASQPADYEAFDHFTFIKNYVNPLFAINQKLITQYKVVSNNYNDYTLNDQCNSIFDKSLFNAQNVLGVYSLVTDKAVLKEIKETGRLLFYDPILSGNNMRSCASCHKSNEYFTDTSFATSLQYDQHSRLLRNTPTLVGVVYNHLLMLDGKHISLQNQGRDVLTNPIEMGSTEKDILDKLSTCKEYKNAFKKFAKYVPEQKELSLDHIVSAITYFYGDFSNYYAPFDDAMNNTGSLNTPARAGFNLFMGKAKCGTCHFVPYFNGVAPPFISSEFESIGVPKDTSYTSISDDKGRYLINPATETMHAFRTGSVRNAEHTKPYMHNGVFNSLDEVMNFYEAGGGAGRKLNVPNQTLASDSLKLTAAEKKDLLSFIHSLNEHVIFDALPKQLPVSSKRELNNRKVGGIY